MARAKDEDGVQLGPPAKVQPKQEYVECAVCGERWRDLTVRFLTRMRLAGWRLLDLGKTTVNVCPNCLSGEEW